MSVQVLVAVVGMIGVIIVAAYRMRLTSSIKSYIQANYESDWLRLSCVVGGKTERLCSIDDLVADIRDGELSKCQDPELNAFSTKVSQANSAVSLICVSSLLFVAVSEWLAL